jgi:predicted metalloprotease
MKMDGRRTSQNIDDRRGKSSSSGKIAGIGGIGGIIIVGIITLLMGGNPLDLLNSGQLSSVIQSSDANYQPTEHEEELAKFASQVLAGTEDVWTAEFKKMGRRRWCCSPAVCSRVAAAQRRQRARSIARQTKRCILTYRFLSRWRAR